MKRISAISFMFIFIFSVYSQINVFDSLKNIMSENIPDSIKIDKINQNIFRYSSNHPEDVLLFADTAIYLSTKIQDSIRLAESHNRKGVALYYLGDFNNSLENYFLALSIKEQSGNTNESWREYNNIGLVLRSQEQNEEALKYFNNVLDGILQTGNKSLEANTWNNIGITYRGMGQYDDARKALEKALEINSNLGNEQAIAYNFNNLGIVSYNTKNYIAALSFFKKALDINIKLLNRHEHVRVLSNMSELYINTNDFIKAAGTLADAESILNEIRADALKLDLLSVYSDFYEKQEDYKNALKYKTRYSEMRDSIFSASRTKQFDQLKTIADTEKEIQRLHFVERINTIQNEKLRIQRMIQIGSGLVILIVSFLLIMGIRNLNKIKKLNHSLSERTHEVESLNKELELSNEELSAQRDNLNTALTDLQNAQKQLIQSEKMASLGIMAAGVAHEINNPLNFIMGGYTGLEEYFNEKEKESDEVVPILLNSIKTGIFRASSIVKALGQFSSRSDSNKEICDIHAIMDNCLLMMQNQFIDRITIRKNYSVESITITGNIGKIHQVFINIFSNSVQAIDDKGEISIKTYLDNHNVVTEISDTGYGIESENMPRIMDPFFTTKEPGIGTGLGLSISYSIIKEHQGTIEFQSEYGKGTMTIITLPKRNNQVA